MKKFKRNIQYATFKLLRNQIGQCDAEDTSFVCYNHQIDLLRNFSVLYLAIYICKYGLPSIGPIVFRIIVFCQYQKLAKYQKILSSLTGHKKDKKNQVLRMCWVQVGGEGAYLGDCTLPTRRFSQDHKQNIFFLRLLLA